MKVVAGDPRLLKVTTLEDLALVESGSRCAVIVDYHMHLRDPDERVVHTLEAVERFVETAAARGVDEIGFTEHVYYFRQTRAVWTLPYQLERCVYDLDEYVRRGRRGEAAGPAGEARARGRLRRRAAGRSSPPLLEPYPWDYLLGSVHWLDGLAVDQEPGIWGACSVDEVWRRYFAALAELAASGHVDVLAHPDLAKIFGRRPEPVASTTRRSKASRLEISTAGLHKPVGELYPDAAFSRPRGFRSRSPRTPTSPRTSAATSTAPSSTRVRQATRP